MSDFFEPLLTPSTPLGALPPGSVRTPAPFPGSESVVADAPPPGDLWQKELAGAYRSVETLCKKLHLSDAWLQSAEKAAAGFPLLVTESFLRRMRPGDPNDPLLRQILPVAEETRAVPGFTSDPLDEQQFRPAAGILQKYAGRALLIVTGQCAVHCRYCFRRSYPYTQEPRSAQQWDAAIDLLSRDCSVREVILSGGDPLILSDRRLAQLIARLEAVPHLTRLRIHSRLPVVLPRRITPELLRLLRDSRLQTWLVIHANHANELQRDCADAVVAVRRAGIPVLNQAVLLRGVNDTADALTALAERLGDLGVMFYYLHQLDRVQGAAHFEVPVEIGRRLLDEVRSRTSGFLVPAYVREVPGAAFKSPVLPQL